jgi:hypothetical protein
MQVQLKKTTAANPHNQEKSSKDKEICIKGAHFLSNFEKTGPLKQPSIRDGLIFQSCFIIVDY